MGAYSNHLILGTICGIITFKNNHLFIVSIPTGYKLESMAFSYLLSRLPMSDFVVVIHF